jgi:hypothetical protein
MVCKPGAPMHWSRRRRRDGITRWSPWVVDASGRVRNDRNRLDMVAGRGRDGVGRRTVRGAAGNADDDAYRTEHDTDRRHLRGDAEQEDSSFRVRRQHGDARRQTDGPPDNGDQLAQESSADAVINITFCGAQP